MEPGKAGKWTDLARRVREDELTIPPQLQAQMRDMLQAEFLTQGMRPVKAMGHNASN